MIYQGLKLVALSLLFSAVAAAQSAGAAKIGLINSSAFADEKNGITKYVKAQRDFLTPFMVLQKELDAMIAKGQTLRKEIEDLGKLTVVERKMIDAKIEEAEKLQRDYKFKAEDAKAKYEREEPKALGPVQQAIGKGLQEYAKLKGYALIFDVAKDQNGLLIAIGDQSVDVTKDFIAFYNAKP